MKKAALLLIAAGSVCPNLATQAEGAHPQLLSPSGPLPLNCAVEVSRAELRRWPVKTSQIAAYEWNDGASATGRPSVAEIDGRFYALTHVAETMGRERRLLVAGAEVPVLKMDGVPVGGLTKGRGERSVNFLFELHMALVDRCPV